MDTMLCHADVRIAERWRPAEAWPIWYTLAKNSIKVVHIDCSDWGEAQTRTEEAEGNGTGRDYTSDLELVSQP
jgi:hypothetical protein